jgi:D-serine deaminase-like pyridoxal phosphate-dependent protein
MTPLDRWFISMIIAAGVVVGSWFGVMAYGGHRYDAGHAAAVAERAAVDATAVLTRARENAAAGNKQATDNSTITKGKDDEIADLRRRLAAAPRLRVGPSVCPDRPATATQAEGPAGGDGADPSAGLVSSRADEDFKQLIEAVETDLSTGRACQAFIEKNGLVP